MSISVVYTTITKDENNIIILTVTHKKRAFDKIQHLFMIKTLTKVDKEGTYLNIIKTIYNKPIAKLILNGKKLKPSC